MLSKVSQKKQEWEPTAFIDNAYDRKIGQIPNQESTI